MEKENEMVEGDDIDEGEEIIPPKEEDDEEEF
jgi:hypothetical protein